jgi:TetR/AcrR family transcriptional regulator
MGAVETPDRILEAALRLFAERGYDAVGVQEIAEASGVTKPPLYHHFGSKEGILQALLELHYSQWLALLVPAAAYRGDLRLAIHSVARSFFKLATAHPHFYRLQLCMSYAPPDSAPCRMIAPFIKRQQDVLERTLTEGYRGNGASRAHAAMFTAMLHSQVASWQAQGEALDDERARLVARQFLLAIA